MVREKMWWGSVGFGERVCIHVRELLLSSEWCFPLSLWQIRGENADYFQFQAWVWLEAFAWTSFLGVLKYPDPLLCLGFDVGTHSMPLKEPELRPCKVPLGSQVLWLRWLWLDHDINFAGNNICFLLLTRSLQQGKRTTGCCDFVLHLSLEKLLEKLRCVYPIEVVICGWNP